MPENDCFRQKVLPMLLSLAILAGIVISVEYMKKRPGDKGKEAFQVSETEKMPEGFSGNGKPLFLYENEFLLNEHQQFSPGLAIPFQSLNPANETWLHASARVFFQGSVVKLKSSLVATCNHLGTNYKYISVSLESLPLRQNQWNVISLDYLVPGCIDPHDLVQVYFWYRGGEEIKINNVKVFRTDVSVSEIQK